MIRTISFSMLALVTIGTTFVTADDKQTAWPLFAFDNGVGRGRIPPDEQAKILADLGYDGIGYTGVQNVPAMLKALDARGLKMFSTYVRVDLRPEQPAYDAGLPAAIEQLKGHGTILWLHVHGDKSPSTALDERGIEVIRAIADLADPAGLRVVLYPHTGFYIATMKDAVRLVKKVDRKNVGASFNLCHYLKQNDAQDLQDQLKEVLPHLFVVSINGADSGKTTAMGWDRLIQPLDRGTLDVYDVLSVLKEGGYDGPVGLQCYGIKGDIRENLQRSMAAWKKLSERLTKSD